MITRNFLVIFLFFTLFLEAKAEFHFWFEGQAVSPYKTKLDFEWRYAYRLDQNATRLFFVFQQARGIFKIGESWAVAPGYRQVFHLQSNNKWSPAYEPIFDFQVNKGVGKWNFEYRNRFQYRSRNYRWENRNRIQLITPSVGPLRLVLYQELFYELFTQLVQRRHYFSLDAEVKENFNFRLGYLLRYLKSDSLWQQQNILYFEFYARY